MRHITFVSITNEFGFLFKERKFYTKLFLLNIIFYEDHEQLKQDFEGYLTYVSNLRTLPERQLPLEN
jgi:hypothetical protein